MRRQPKDRPDIQLFAEIGAIDQLATVRIERALPEGLTHAQFAVLNHLVMHGDGATPVDLARAFQLTKGAMTNTLHRLEAAGFVTLTDDGADGRKKRIAVTPEGLAAHNRCTAAVRPLTEGLRQAFSEKDFEAVLPFLQALRAWLGQAG
jgi:DNA-binding MarR family transcriptional regulator